MATPAQDLDCAIWASHVAGTTDDPQRLQGVSAILGYFIGRYESAQAENIDDAMMARSLVLTTGDIAALNDRCEARAVTYGNRLIALGQRMVEAARQLQQ